MTSERDALLRAEQEFTVEVARTPEMIEAAFRLRYQVYCRERGYERGRGERETDPFDSHARHVILTQRSTGQVIGTVRVIAGSNAGPGLPLQHLVPAYLLNTLPLGSTGEVSRFALSKDLRDTAGASSAMLRLALVQGALRLSKLMEISHWCAVMEPSLLRLLRTSGIHFQTLGPVVEYHGMRQPCAASITCLFARLRREQPRLWDYITADGTLLPATADAV